MKRYLANKFGEHLDEYRDALAELAGAFSEEGLREDGYRLYEAFRPDIPRGVAGWGAPGALSLDKIRSLKENGW